MATEYTIYIVNKNDKRKFWLFLSAPEELSGLGVYANSSAYMTVAPNYIGTNSFTIPVQYVIGAAASSNAVGLGVRVSSVNTQQTDLKQEWKIQYAPPANHEGPTVTKGSDPQVDQIWLDTLEYEKGEEPIKKWYASQSFGIETDSGYIGMTWSPITGETRKITPKLAFYVATGDYESNSLASWNQVSDGAAKITEESFSPSREVTVTRTSAGGWDITPGAPPKTDIASSLVVSHQLLCEAHVKLVNSLAESGYSIAASALNAEILDEAGSRVICRGTCANFNLPTITITNLDTPNVIQVHSEYQVRPVGGQRVGCMCITKVGTTATFQR